MDGIFVEAPNGVWQREKVALVDQTRFVAQIFADWIKTIAR